MPESVAVQILLVEDEANVGSTLQQLLEGQQYGVMWCKNATDAGAAIAKGSYDLVLLDVGLPDGNGFDIAKKFREKNPHTPIVFLTAYGAADDRVRGLELGAVDYIVKPFHMRELILRIQNALKSAKPVAHDDPERKLINIGEAVIDFAGFSVQSQGHVHQLSAKECQLLKLLYERRGSVVSRDDILNLVWSEDEFPTPRTVDNFVVRLRKMIEKHPDQPEIIKSVRGVGYLLSDQQRSSSS